MRLVADASRLVGEIMRVRGRRLIRRPDLEIYISTTVHSEIHYEVPRHIREMARHARLHGSTADELIAGCFELIARHLRTVLLPVCGPAEYIARRRVPRDPNDWSIVAQALVLEADIWTHDHDFLGCGVATWTTDTLLLHLNA